ncbi:hypothetical protein AWENTII_002282 [Aspergillus wentii]
MEPKNALHVRECFSSVTKERAASSAEARPYFFTILAKLELLDDPRSTGSKHPVRNPLHYEWNFKHHKYELDWYADYTLFYGQPWEVESNLLVVEAKKDGEYGDGIAQCLGYMDMIW